MIDFLETYKHLIDQVIINSILALSQYLVFRAGVFSIATAGFAAIGGYAAAIATTKYGLHPLLGGGMGVVLATLLSMALAFPLAKLRGVFQGIATLAFVQIVVSVILNTTPLTNGPSGINGIPSVATTPILLGFLLCTVFVVICLGASRVGRAFDTIREDETVAVSLGISVFHFQFLAFVLSGAIAGLGGALEAYNSFSIAPNSFGFSLVVACLTFVVLGGRSSVWGPVVGAVVLTLLPEVARPLEDNRLLVHGALLVVTIIYLEHGIVDTLIIRYNDYRLSRARRGETSPAAGTSP